MPANNAEENARQQREWYSRNADKKKRMVWNRRREIYKKLWEYKSTLECEKCGFTHPATLDFHHKDPYQKDFGISHAALQGRSWDRIMEEITKCKVLCSNCHRILHYNAAMV